MQKNTELEILLASKSPRRHQLITSLGFGFKVIEQDIEEHFPRDLPKARVPAFLAEAKAFSVKEQLKNVNQVILTADTIVLMDNTIFHKPKDRDDAIRILKQLSGRMHKVVTGVCLMGLNKQKVFSDVARVYFEKLKQEEIEYYVDTFEPFDKAGAYAIQEWIGLSKIQKIEGTYANIMGLPTHLVYKALKEW